jgi:hypothetical protein
MALVHSFLGGFLYYMFPKLTVFTALLSNATHLAMEGRKGVWEMLRHICTNAETLILVVVHFLFFGYGIFSMYFNPPPTDWVSWALLAAILPVPMLFYVLTARLTEPLRGARVRR